MLINKALSDTEGKADFYIAIDYPEESGLRKRIYNAGEVETKQIQVTVDRLDNYSNIMGGLKYIKW